MSGHLGKHYGVGLNNAPCWSELQLSLLDTNDSDSHHLIISLSTWNSFKRNSSHALPSPLYSISSFHCISLSPEPPPCFLLMFP